MLHPTIKKYLPILLVLAVVDLVCLIFLFVI
jgi:hypothetical protein